MRRRVLIFQAFLLVAMPVWAAKPVRPVAIPTGVSVCTVEADTGVEIFARDADTVRPPASMIKLALMLLVSEGIDEGKWNLDTPVTATKHAEKMGGTQVYVKTGETYPLRQLMLGVAVASANDAAMAVAEGLWGAEDAYLDAANARIQELGMEKSVFRSVHGLPPDRGEKADETTARDMTKLARECMKYAQIREWVGTKRFRFRPEDAEHISTNKLLQMMDECDGMKTGYIRAAGFCIAATAKRGDLRVITVVMGHPESMPRFRIAQQQLNDGFSAMRKDRVFVKATAEKPVIAVENGREASVPVQVSDDIWAVTKTADWERIKLVWNVPQTLAAPVKAGTEVGEVRAELDGHVLGQAKVMLGGSVEQTTWMWRTEKMIRDYLKAD